MSNWKIKFWISRAKLKIGFEQGEELIIYEFNSNSSEKIRISLEDFKGKKLLQIRVYENYQDGRGFQPTYKSVTINANKASELRRGIDKLFTKILMEEDRDF